MPHPIHFTTDNRTTASTKLVAVPLPRLKPPFPPHRIPYFPHWAGCYICEIVLFRKALRNLSVSLAPLCPSSSSLFYVSYFLFSFERSRVPSSQLSSSHALPMMMMMITRPLSFLLITCFHELIQQILYCVQTHTHTLILLSFHSFTPFQTQVTSHIQKIN